MSTVQNAIERLDKSGKALEEQKDAIKAMESLGYARAEIFVRDIQASLMTAGEEKSNKTVPITFIVSNIREVRAFSSSEVDNIGKVVSSALSAFLNPPKKEEVAFGVGNTVTKMLEVYLGRAEASSDSIEVYYVATDGICPVRVDIKAWYYSASSSSIRTQMERITTVVATKSVIDVSKIDIGTFLYLYSTQLNAADLTQEELSQALDDAREVYEKFTRKLTEQGKLPTKLSATPQELREQYNRTVGKPKDTKDTITKINNPVQF